MRLDREKTPRSSITLLLSCLLLGGFGAFASGCFADDETQKQTTPTDDNPGTTDDNSGTDDPFNEDSDTVLDESDSPEIESPSATPIESSETLQTAMEAPSNNGDPAVTVAESPIEYLDGWWLVNAPTAVFNSGARYRTEISVPVNVVSQEKLISFIHNNRQLFTDTQYETLARHNDYLTRGYGSGLLLGMVGVVLEDDFDYFRDNPSASMAGQTQQERDFLQSLSELHEASYTMSGKPTAVATSYISSSPRYHARATRLKFANGKVLRAIDTRLKITDENGGSRIVGLKNERPLVLLADGSTADLLDVTYGYGTLHKAAEELDPGEKMTLPISKAVNCVSHERLVEFISEHRALFSDAEYQSMINAGPYTDETRTPELLLGVLGVKLGSSFAFFSQISTIEIAAYDAGDQQLVDALSELENKSYTLSGSHTVVGVGSFSAVPYVYARATRVVLPNGNFFRVISTQVQAADADGSQTNVRSEEGSAPFSLIAN